MCCTIGCNDGTSDNNYRYIGKNPNNYIYFNCSDYNNPSSKTCEKWRIIGILNVDDGTGTKSRRLKIVRESLPIKLSWDSSRQTTSGNGVNEWSQADLMKLMNPGFDNNKDYLFTSSGSYEKEDLVNNSLYWYNTVFLLQLQRQFRFYHSFFDIFTSLRNSE